MLEIRNLNLDVGDGNKKVRILKNINLTLEDNKFYVITGPNGGGKSSLAKTVMGIYRPASGQIIFDGQDITDLEIEKRAQLGIAYAFQQPPRFKGITVRDLLKLAGEKSGKKIDVCELLFNVGLCSQDYLEREIDSSLSGGELKRIEIASVLARGAKLAIFDEPEAGIDLWSFQRLADAFRKIYEKRSATIVIISHQERIINLADEVILIADGMIKDITTKESILSRISTDGDCRFRGSCEKGVFNDVECIG